VNEEHEQVTASEGPDWLSIARDAFAASTNYLDANWRKKWERNIALFQSRHPDGSKYNSTAFKGRSRLFRPKTKSVVRKNEAAAAAAFFANVDVVTLEPENDGDPLQVAGAQVVHELLNYRLTKTIPWFLTLLGALQEAQVIGIVASYQYWKYKEKPGEPQFVPVVDDIGQPLTNEAGEPYFEQTQGEPIVIEDKPCVELIPVENIRFDPGADWTNVVGSTPYLIRMVPMYVDSVRQQMKAQDSKTGMPKWKQYSDGDIRSAMAEYDSLRQARENKSQDPKADNGAPLKEFEIVWCHENFVRLDGEEVVYWTLGTQHLLSEPVPLKEAYFHGERPIVIGCAVLEAHKAVPESEVAIGAELQKELNETVNQRRDNVSLVLNKRYVVKRGKSVDIESLLRNAPGSVTMADNPMEDVQPMQWADVTASSYQEQDRLNVDFDELTGNFSQGSVMTNRKLNETVGGMSMMGGAANQMTEYLIRTFVETWVEPVLRQLVKLEKEYETDAEVLGLAFGKAEIENGADVEELLRQPLTVRVNVGLGATNPQQKLGSLIAVFQAYSGIMANTPDAEPEEVRNALFGMAGYKGGARFFKKLDGGGDPEKMQMQAQMQEMSGALQEAQAAAREAQLATRKQELIAQERGIEAKGKDIELRVATMSQGQADPAANDLRNELDRELERIAHERELLARDKQLFDSHKRIAMLEMRAAGDNMSHAAEQLVQAQSPPPAAPGPASTKKAGPSPSVAAPVDLQPLADAIQVLLASQQQAADAMTAQLGVVAELVAMPKQVQIVRTANGYEAVASLART